MIIIEAIRNFVVFIWTFLIKPVIRTVFWLITARDCHHCKYHKYDRQGNGKRYYHFCCKVGTTKNYHTKCYYTITRKDFEKKQKKKRKK